jgi:hypothetical protein
MCEGVSMILYVCPLKKSGSSMCFFRKRGNLSVALVR